MPFIGFLSDLTHEPTEPVQYFLPLKDQQQIPVNDWLGKSVEIRYLGEKSCRACGRKVNKLFNNGYCYPCFTKLAECDLCIMKPQECHHHLGTCRDQAFADSHCMTPHYVYLALSSSVKVGLTRKSRGKARWIDQGAVQAIPIAELPTRKLAGDLEVIISQHIPDKTNWRKMLTGQIDEVDLWQVRKQIQDLIPETFKPYLLAETELLEFAYPVSEFLEKIKSVSFDKQESISGRLLGIKGQYFIFDHAVLNIKKHTGYKVEIRISE